MKTIDNEEFIEACKNGDLAEVKRVFEDPSWGTAEPGQMPSALVQAASTGHLDIVRYLIEIKRILQAPYLMADKHLAICVAAENRHVEVVKYLIGTFSQP